MKLRDLLGPTDPLGEALHFLRMSGAFYCRCEFSAPWALELPSFEDSLMFHAVTSGPCWLEARDDSPRSLQPGELALIPHGEGHRLASAPGIPPAKLFELPRELASERYEVLRHGGGGAPTTVVCGVIRFEHPAAQRLVRLLPRVLCFEASSSPQNDWMQHTLRLMAAEARELLPGGETVITRLCDILIVQAIRSWIAQDPAARTGWLGALQDRQMGRALALIHRDPARAWTVASLADEVAMSRSALSERFTKLVGEPVMQYLTRWRMHLAMSWLSENDWPLAELAHRLGYQSEAAFSRAFKRCNGVSPGAVRQSSRVPVGPGRRHEHVSN